MYLSEKKSGAPLSYDASVGLLTLRSSQVPLMKRSQILHMMSPYIPSHEEELPCSSREELSIPRMRRDLRHLKRGALRSTAGGGAFRFRTRAQTLRFFVGIVRGQAPRLRSSPILHARNNQVSGIILSSKIGDMKLSSSPRAE